MWLCDPYLSGYNIYNVLDSSYFISLDTIFYQMLNLHNRNQTCS